MKKFTLFCLFFIGLGLYANAQAVKLTCYTPDGKYATWYSIDRTAKTFEYDSDSDGITYIRNYKKTGNKETFDVYPKFDPSITIHNIVIYCDEGKEQWIQLNLNGEEQYKYTFKLDSQLPAGVDPRFSSASDTNTPANIADDPKSKAGQTVDKAAKGVKNLVNKGVNVFKKKK